MDILERGRSDPKGVAAVDRALSILHCFRDGLPSLSLAELSARTGLYKSTILRLTESLEKAGFIQRDVDKNFRLGWALGQLGQRYRGASNLERHIRPVLIRLRDETGESSSFYRRDGDMRTCLLREESRQVVRDHIEEGTMLPLALGAAGHVLTAFEILDVEGPTLPLVSVGERDPEVSAIAVPTFGENGVLVGALTISGPSSRLTAERARSLFSMLLREAKSLSLNLGAPAGPLLDAVFAGGNSF